MAKSRNVGPKTNGSSTSRKVRLDQLKWQPIELPDRMDDYEGFYGLEEIDGVDILKDDNGLMSYHATGNNLQIEQETPRHQAIEDDEFQGFSDENDENHKVNESQPAVFTETGSRKRSAVESTRKDKLEGPVSKKQKKTIKNNTSTPDAFSPTMQSASTPTSGFAAIASLNETDDFVNGDSTRSEVDVSAWRPLGLSPDTLAALSHLGFSNPTPIQTAAVPAILSGHDVIGKASTGSGKTLAFGIPIFESWLEATRQRRYNRPPRQHQKTTMNNKDDGGSKKDNSSQDRWRRNPPLALIITPTRELAHQLAAHLDALAAGLAETTTSSTTTTTAKESESSPQRPKIATLTGGLSIQKQTRILSEAADIVIGTPGRIWEIMSSRVPGVVGWLRRVEYLVLDEADRLLSKGSFKELEEVLKWLDQDSEDGNGIDTQENDDDAPTEMEADDRKVTRQTLVFSATFEQGLQQKLAGKAKSASSLDRDSKESMEYLLARLRFQSGVKPKYIDVNPTRQMAGNLKEGLVECAGIEKDLYLYSILLLHQSSRSLVFVNSISAVRRLVPFLQNLNLNALALHSQMPQKARLRSIERFSGQGQQPGSGKGGSKGSILVATDVAARGLDIPQVQLVVHYHLPRASDTYVHRSGRTARAGESGSSILICGPEEVAGVRRLVAKVHAGTSKAKASADDKKQGRFIRTLNIDRRIVGRLKPRATLAKRLADVSTAHEKKSAATEMFKAAAEDLGVEYDSEEMEKNESKGKRGRGAGRLKKEREARSLSKDEVRNTRAELNQLLKQRVNVGVSERYLTSGRVDIDQLLEAGADALGGDFLGLADGAGLDDD